MDLLSRINQNNKDHAGYGDEDAFLLDPQNQSSFVVINKGARR